MTWGIMTPGHAIFIAKLIERRLNKHGWSVEVFTSSPAEFDCSAYIVICPQVFERLPPGEKRISFQMEQSVSSRWFTDKYIKILANSLAVLEYSLINLEFLEKKKISYPHVHYLPIGASSTYGEHVYVDEKLYEVVFYGDSKSSRRRQTMLDALQKYFNVHVVNNPFGDDMIRVLKQSKVIVNIHYYENSLLEMPRIQECLSLGLKVVSESSQDQDDYPELDGAVRYFQQNSIEEMVEAVRQALKESNAPIENSVAHSEKKFSFMFDRFLIAIGFLSASHINDMDIPISSDADTFGLSLPETINRRRVFESGKPTNCVNFDGLRRRPGWIGCGLSYSALAKHALKHGLKSITVMEDDVILPPDYADGLNIIQSYLKGKGNDWDIFSGIIASLHPEVDVLNVEEYSGKMFVTINKMTSTVFNIYSESAMHMLCRWNPEDAVAATNTIDRYLESQEKLRVIVMLPFFVGHREEVNSTLWGFQNTQYCEMILDSEKLLLRKVDDFLELTAKNSL